ncbi:MAG: hypothetical protein MZU95_09100 [Desulfomicrobium escambiense]|nr:hypothetical protein [Desulfomicrobium escambiense]
MHTTSSVEEVGAAAAPGARSPASAPPLRRGGPRPPLPLPVRPAGARRAAGAGAVKAPMPGTILAVKVAAGPGRQDAATCS